MLPLKSWLIEINLSSDSGQVLRVSYTHSYYCDTSRVDSLLSGSAIMCFTFPYTATLNINSHFMWKSNTTSGRERIHLTILQKVHLRMEEICFILPFSYLLCIRSQYICFNQHYLPFLITFFYTSFRVFHLLTRRKRGFALSECSKLSPWKWYIVDRE